MARIFFKKRQLRVSVAATLGFVTLCFAALAYLAAGPLFKIDMLRQLWGHGDDMNIRLRLVTVAIRLVALGTGFTVIGLLHGALSPRVRISWRGLTAVLLIALMGWPVWHVYNRAKAAPAIHDIGTNLEDPPPLSAWQGDNQGAANGFRPGDRNDPLYNVLHHAAYADLVPLQLKLRPADALAKAATVATILGWKIQSIDSKSGLMQASRTDDWFGFESRIIVRVRANAAGTMLDIRAVSDMAGSDWGTGARLIRSFLNLMAL